MQRDRIITISAIEIEPLENLRNPIYAWAKSQEKTEFQPSPTRPAPYAPPRLCPNGRDNLVALQYTSDRLVRREWLGEKIYSGDPCFSALLVRGFWISPKTRRQR
jgi:hypothetical protein